MVNIPLFIGFQPAQIGGLSDFAGPSTVAEVISQVFRSLDGCQDLQWIEHNFKRFSWRTIWLFNIAIWKITIFIR